MWHDYYLKFSTEADYTAQMPENLMGDASEVHATDVIGTLYRDDTFEALEGFHVNLRLKDGTPLPPELEPFCLPVPVLPKRVFA